MSWLGRGDRRRRARRPYEPEQAHEPTYLVERDAPSGPPMDPNVRWFSRALKRARGETYDAYPDHLDVPWHVVGPPGPVAPVRPIRDRLPKPRTHPVSLYVKRYGKLREVKLLGLPLEMALRSINRRIVAGWVMSEIADTLAQMEEDEVSLESHRDDGDQRGEEAQGLAEYALILALVAIIAIVALIVMGNQIAATLQNVADCIPDPSTCV